MREVPTNHSTNQIQSTPTSDQTLASVKCAFGEVLNATGARGKLPIFDGRFFHFSFSFKIVTVLAQNEKSEKLTIVITARKRVNNPPKPTTWPWPQDIYVEGHLLLREPTQPAKKRIIFHPTARSRISRGERHCDAQYMSLAQAGGALLPYQHCYHPSLFGL